MTDTLNEDITYIYDLSPLLVFVIAKGCVICEVCSEAED